MTTDSELRQLAVKARNTLSQPMVTGYRVGAALLTNNGEVFLGANIENITLALTVCAERTALFNALMNGQAPMTFTKIAITGPDGVGSIAPCGPCLQLLREYCGLDLEILFIWDGIERAEKLSTMFPFPTTGVLN